MKSEKEIKQKIQELGKNLRVYGNKQEVLSWIKAFEWVLNDNEDNKE